MWGHQLKNLETIIVCRIHYFFIKPRKDITVSVRGGRECFRYQTLAIGKLDKILWVMNYECSWIRLSNLQKECLQTVTESYLTHMFEQANLCALHAKRVTGKTQKISHRNGIIWKNMAQVVKLFSVMPKDLNLVKRLQEMNI